MYLIITSNRGHKCHSDDDDNDEDDLDDDYYDKTYFLVDINECNQTSSLCTFVCKNFIGGYKCRCPPGFRGDGTTCKGERNQLFL